MSRVGRQVIFIPSSVEVKAEAKEVFVKGPKGELRQKLPDFLNIEIKDEQIKLSVENSEIKNQRSLWGTFARLISNMIKGVNEEFEKKLELVGVGYRAQVGNGKLTLNIGFSHSVDFLIPQGIGIKVEQNIIIIRGVDKQLVGETAARIRRLKKPEPYKGKGIKYFGEFIKRKAGKKAVASSK